MKFRHKPSILQTHHELFPTHNGVMRCIAQPLRGELCQCCGVKWGARVLRVRSVSREEVWASAGMQGAWVGGCGCEAD